MKGRLKDRIKIGMVIAFSLIAATIIISIISGRISTVPIVMVTKDGLDITKPLDEQKDFFEIKEISKSDMEKFKGSVVTDFSELAGKKVMTNLQAGSPILKVSLYEKNGGGNFALQFPKGFTVRALPGAIIGLPPMAVGDKINIGLTYKLQKIDAEGKTVDYDTSSIVLEDLQIVNIIGPDLYVKVTLQEDVIFEVLKTIGTLYYQLPGQMDENGNVIEESGNNTVNSKEILEKIQNGEILNTEINLKDLLETGLEGVKEGEVVVPETDEETETPSDGATQNETSTETEVEGGDTNE